MLLFEKDRLLKLSSTLDNLSEYCYINLKTKYPEIFGSCTLANIIVKGKQVIFNIDSGSIPNTYSQGTLYTLPEELKYLMPSQYCFGVLCTSNAVPICIWLNPGARKIGTYSQNSVTPATALYGQLSWIIV